MAEKKEIAHKHYCLNQKEIDEMSRVVIALKDVPKDVSDIKNELLGTEYTQNKGLIHETAKNTEEINQLKQQYNLDKARVLGISTGVALIISIVYKIIFG